jgi:ribosomal-protein-alanine N-acetyltransferase
MTAGGPDWRIAPLGALDLDLAATLYARAFDAPWERRWSREEFAGLLSAPGGFGMLLREGGEPVGLAVMRAIAGEAEVVTLGVSPAARRRGGARALLDAALFEAQTRGAREVFLEVAHDNAAARALYERRGFVAVGRRREYYDRGLTPPVDAIVMRIGPL